MGLQVLRIQSQKSSLGKTSISGPRVNGKCFWEGAEVLKWGPGIHECGLNHSGSGVAGVISTCHLILPGQILRRVQLVSKYVYILESTKRERIINVQLPSVCVFLSKNLPSQPW